MRLIDRLVSLTRRRPTRRQSRWLARRPLGEQLEARQVLSAVGFPGNDCAPEIDLSAIADRAVVADTPITIDLPAEGATLIDLDSDGNPTGDNLRWLADPDTGVDFPEGASLTPAGVFTWTPTAEDARDEPYRVRIIGIDSGTPALANADSFFITVSTPNEPPTLADPDDAQVLTGVEFTFQADANDPGDTLTFSLGDPPAGGNADQAVIDPDTGVFSWTPDTPGIYDFEIVVEDDGAPPLEARQTVRIEVGDENVAPDLVAPAAQQVVAGQPLPLQFQATDDNAGDTLTFILTNPGVVGDGNPAASLSETGAFTWTPMVPRAEPYVFQIMVTDDGFISPLADAEELSVTVLEAPVAPVIDPIADVEVEEGTPIAFSVVANDGNAADTVTFTLTDPATAGAPNTEVAGIDMNTGAFGWTPDVPGTYIFDVVATDNSADLLSSTATFQVTVTERPEPPVLAFIEDQVIGIGQELVVPLSAIDPNEGDFLSFALSSSDGPAGAVVNTIESGVGEFRWTPTAEDAAGGPVTATVQVDDFSGQGPVSQQFTITFDTTAPTVLSPVSGALSPAAEITVVFSEEVDVPNGNFTLLLADGNNSIDIPISGVSETAPDTFVLTLPDTLAEGSYVLTVENDNVFDAFGNEMASSATIVLMVEAPPV